MICRIILKGCNFVAVGCSTGISLCPGSDMLPPHILEHSELHADDSALIRRTVQSSCYPKLPCTFKMLKKRNLVYF